MKDYFSQDCSFHVRKRSVAVREASRPPMSGLPVYTVMLDNLLQTFPHSSILGVQVFESFVGVLRLIETVKPPPLAPGLEHLMKQANQGSQGNGATGSSYARTEADAVWNCIQKEIQKLLAELLQHSSQQGNHREYQAYGEFTYQTLLHTFRASSLQGPTVSRDAPAKFRHIKDF